MNDDRTDTPSEGASRDPRLDSLNADWLGHRRAYERREAEHHETLDRQRTSYDAMLSRKNRQADLTEEIELNRLQAMRRLRSELDREVMAAQDVAARAFAKLNLKYVPGRSSVDDLYWVNRLPVAEAADRAGIPIAATFNDRLLKGLKFAGMAGCLLLGTIGMGALLLHVPPKTLFHSPLFVVALGLGLILVGGAYLIVAPSSRRLGALTASRPGDPETKQFRLVQSLLVAVVTVIVALVDTKALMAINAARALVNPDAAPSFALTFLIAMALSATYVVGSAMLAFHEGFHLEASERIEAEQVRHVEGHRKRQSASLEVSQACEA